jgi:hypothetical protein
LGLLIERYRALLLALAFPLFCHGPREVMLFCSSRTIKRCKDRFEDGGMDSLLAGSGYTAESSVTPTSVWVLGY